MAAVRKKKKPFVDIALEFLGKLPESTQEPDKALAEKLHVSARQVQKCLSFLAKEKLLVIERQRYPHPQFGWCNTRTVKKG